MARICIRVLSNNHPIDSSLDLFRTQLGDVVCVQPDGHVWSAAELNCGQYRFIEVPGIAAGVFDYLVIGRFDAEETLLRIRNVGIDVTVLGTGSWRNRTTATKMQIDAIVIVKT